MWGVKRARDSYSGQYFVAKSGGSIMVLPFAWLHQALAEYGSHGRLLHHMGCVCALRAQVAKRSTSGSVPVLTWANMAPARSSNARPVLAS